MHRRTLLNAACQTTALAGLGLHTASRAQGITDSLVVLGQSAPFSGPAEQLGLQFHLGAQLHFEALNAKGGVNGRRIELKRLDDGYEPERCVANTKQLIADEVFALFGYVGTPTSLAALPLVTAAKIPFFAPFTGAEGLRNPFNRHVLHVRASYFEETAAIVKQITGPGITKVAVFHQNDAYGKAGLEGVVRALKTLNMEPMATGTVERNSSDVSGALASIMPTRPEAIVQIGAYQACAAFIREARKQGFSGNFYNVSFVGTQALVDDLGPDAKGVVISQVMPFPYAPLSPLSTEYLAAIKASKTPPPPNYSGMEGYVAAKVFAEGLRRAGKSPTRDGFVQGVESLQSLDLGGFLVDFSAKKHVGSQFAELTRLSGDGRVRR